MKAKSILIWCSMILLLHSAGISARAQEFSDPNAGIVLRYYINHDCAVGDDSAALSKLLAYGTLVQSTLIIYLRQGPDDSSLAALQADLYQPWTKLEAYLRTKSGEPIEQKRQLFFQLHRKTFIQKYREKSAIALAAIGSPEAVRALQDMRTTENEGLRTVINAAMRQFQR